MKNDDGHCVPLAIGADYELTPVPTLMKQKAGLQWGLSKEYFTVLEENSIINTGKTNKVWQLITHAEWLLWSKIIPPLNSNVEPSVPQNVTRFEDEVFKEVIKLKWGH